MPRTADSVWARMVAAAAPAIPIWKFLMKIKSRAKFNMIVQIKISRATTVLPTEREDG